MFGRTITDTSDVRNQLAAIGPVAGPHVTTRPNFLDVVLRKSLLRKDFRLICTDYRSHVLVFRKLLSCNELRDLPCTQKAVGESGCSIDLEHCLATTCN